MKTRRLFYAAVIPDSTVKELSELQKIFSQHGVRGRKISEAKVHMTLHFLGEVPETELLRLCTNLDRVSAGLSPFEIHITRLGCFSQSRGKLIYAEADVPSELTAVADRLKTESGLGDMKAFKPHITLIRNADRTTNIGELNSLIPIQMKVIISEVALFESAWNHGKPEYRPVHRRILV